MATSPTLERSVSPLQSSSASPARRPSRLGRIPLLCIVFAIGLATFVGTDRAWILLVLTVAMGFGADGILRSHPRGEFHTVADTAPYLFVPVLFTMSAGLFLEDVILGY